MESINNNVLVVDDDPAIQRMIGLVDASIQIIAEERGVHFDPDVIDAFFSIQPTILEIRDRFQEKDGKNSDSR
jgi:hypothetical protein